MIGFLSAVASATPTPNTVSTVTDAMTTGLGSAGSDMLGAMAAVIPVVIGVLIAYAIIQIGIRVFKMFTKRG